jgi:Tol biopolymer transport system component
VNKTKTIIVLLIAIIIGVSTNNVHAASKKHNAYSQKHYTTESPHFRFHYHRGLDHLIPRVANKLEQLRQIYAETYNISLPGKTDVVLYESEMSDAFAYSNFNFLYLGVHDYEFNMRGSSDWFDDVLAHEYAHVVSIWTGLKFPPSVSEIQLGYFTHPNSASRFEGLHVLPSETMPIWFLEGIAQYESSRRGADSWDSHRDMILRTLTLSDKLLSWPHMQVFAGKGDDFEKSYNQGFSLITYIADTYGYEKIVSILRENAKVGRLSFDGAVKAVLGISAKQLYNDWQEQLSRRYNAQIKAVGTQVYGRKINKDGFDNGYPKFSPDGKKIYFLSSGDNDYAFLDLYSYNLSDTVAEKKKIRYEMPVGSVYDIHNASGRITFVSPRGRKSFQETRLGGQRTFDLYVDELPPEKPKFFGKDTEKQVTTGKSVFASSFSPKGDQLVCAVRKFDKFFLAITDTSGSDMRIVYPPPGVNFASEFFRSTELPKSSDTAGFSTIFSLAWSPNGKDIAVDYIDGDRRKIGIYDTLHRTFSVFGDCLEYDRRNPSFNKDGSVLYFSSDETEIFNVYRYTFASGKLERLTNVSGGAFHPAVSDDGKKLVYSGYDRNGYGIYLIDTLKSLRTSTIDAADAITERARNTPQRYSTPLSNRLKYSRMPRQTLIVPTLLAEQLVTADNDEFKGVTHVKGGVVANFLDPLSWSDVGNEFGAFLLVDLKRIFEFIDFDKGLISPRASYDAGVFGTSKAFPVTVEGEAMVRGIAGEDWFYEESEDTTMVLPYRIQLTNLMLGASHPIADGLYGRLFLGLDRYDVALDLSEAYSEGVFTYNLSKGYRAGAMTWFSARGRNSRSNISPTGIAGKLQYNLWRQYSLKEENSFSVESNMLKERYDDYLFHLVDGRLLLGMSSPIYSKHDVHLSLAGSFLNTVGGGDIPSFYLPAAQVPGYAYFYKDKRAKVEFGDTTWVRYDTVLVTGKAVLSGQFSYRFPLWPGSIDKKLGFLYFDMLYGALNFSAGAGFGDPGKILDWERKDWLFSYGAEARLEALSFNNYPLCLSFRWDYGADRTGKETFVDDREITLGGHRFAFTVGFDFDGWGMMPVTDYFSPSKMKMTPTLRPGGRRLDN